MEEDARIGKVAISLKADKNSSSNAFPGPCPFPRKQREIPFRDHPPKEVFSSRLLDLTRNALQG
jgi:hypothetical protein